MKRTSTIKNNYPETNYLMENEGQHCLFFSSLDFNGGKRIQLKALPANAPHLSKLENLRAKIRQ